MRIPPLIVLFAAVLAGAAPHAARADGPRALSALEVGTLHVEKFGKAGSAIVLVPGLACGTWEWEPLVAELASTHVVYAVTPAGVDGLRAAAAPGFQSLLDALDEVVHATGTRPVLVGHSLGGTLALAEAAAHPDAVAGVISIEGLAVFPGTEGLPTAEREQRASLLRAQLASLDAAGLRDMQAGYFRNTGVLSETLAARLAPLAARSDPRSLAAYAGDDLALDLRALLPAIQVPVLVISPWNEADYRGTGIGADDKAGYYRALLAGVHDLQVASVVPARHFAQFDQPGQVLDLVRHFLSPQEAAGAIESRP